MAEDRTIYDQPEREQRRWWNEHRRRTSEIEIAQQRGLTRADLEDDR